MAANRLKLLARAEARIFQCVVIDQNFRKRNIVVYICGPDAYWSDTREGLFDADRARRCPPWLIEQVTRPPEGVDCYDWQGDHLVGPASAGQVPSPATAPSSAPLADLGGESSIAQG